MSIKEKFSAAASFAFGMTTIIPLPVLPSLFFVAAAFSGGLNRKATFTGLAAAAALVAVPMLATSVERTMRDDASTVQISAPQP